MKQYIDNVGKTIPKTLRFSQHIEIIKDTYSLLLYGYYEDTGWRGFFKKVKQGIKAKLNG